jgi:pantoate--beta-alanine ligase
VTRPLLVATREELRTARAALDGTVALVPTMGALHDGHLALVARAREIADHVVVSDFVNPLQFGPDEDFDRYPRDLEADRELLAGAADLLFAPSVTEMYPGFPAGPLVRVDAGPMATILEGATRPGHFDGVLTVVTRLLGLVRPDVAVFGQKDAQQLALVRRCVEDLALPVRIEAVPIRRDADGLALSSRNVYLSDEDRAGALVLARTVAAARAAAPDTTAVLAALERARSETPDVAWDYLLTVDEATFREIGPEFAGRAVVVMAARFGTTRLLDNVPLTLGGGTVGE